MSSGRVRIAPTKTTLAVRVQVCRFRSKQAMGHAPFSRRCHLWADYVVSLRNTVLAQCRIDSGGWQHQPWKAGEDAFDPSPYRRDSRRMVSAEVARHRTHDVIAGFGVTLHSDPWPMFAHIPVAVALVPVLVLLLRVAIWRSHIQANLNAGGEAPLQQSHQAGLQGLAAFSLSGAFRAPLQPVGLAQEVHV